MILCFSLCFRIDADANDFDSEDHAFVLPATVSDKVGTWCESGNRRALCVLLSLMPLLLCFSSSPSPLPPLSLPSPSSELPPSLSLSLPILPSFPPSFPPCLPPSISACLLFSFPASLLFSFPASLPFLTNPTSYNILLLNILFLFSKLN